MTKLAKLNININELTFDTIMHLQHELDDINQTLELDYIQPSLSEYKLNKLEARASMIDDVLNMVSNLSEYGINIYD